MGIVVDIDHDERDMSSLTPPLSPLAAESMDLLANALLLPQTIHLGNQPDSPVDNVRRLLESAVPLANSNSSEHRVGASPPLFCEMLYLATVEEEEDDDDEEEEEEGDNADRANSSTPSHTLLTPSPLLWQQTNRWIKYEQAVEGGASRFGKPHITLLTMHSLVQIKSCLKRGVVLLDVEALDYPGVVQQLIDGWADAAFLIDEANVKLVRDVLNAPKMHLVRKRMRKIDEDTSEEAMKERRGSALVQLKPIVGPKPTMYILTRKSSAESEGYEKREEGEDEEQNKHEDADTRLMKKLPPETDAAVIMVANVATLPRPLTAFVRLRDATFLYPQVPDLPIPVKFLYVLMNPVDNYHNETIGLGRAFGALFSDEIFQRVAYISLGRHTLVDAVDEFISQLVAIPPGKCHLETRWNPSEKDTEVRNVGMLYTNYERQEDPYDELSTPCPPNGGSSSGAALQLFSKPANYPQPLPGIHRTGRLFGGLAADLSNQTLRQKAPWYISDFADFFRGRFSQSLAATVLMFFANITNIITFGAVMERALNHQMAAIENIVCGGICGIVYGLLSGQPLNVLSATGPTLVFEKILYDFCTAHQWEFLPFRFWVGVWITLFLLMLVATDASALVGLITRFSEEAFATLISVVFIIQAFEKLYEIGHEAPLTRHPEEVLHSACHCIIPLDGGRLAGYSAGVNLTSSATSTAYKNLSVGVTKCRELGGTPQGLQCFFKPDVYLFSVLLTFGTFTIASKLNAFRRSPYLGAKVRNLISDFGVLIAIASMTLLAYFMGLEVPTLKIPSAFRPTLDRGWLVDVMAVQGAHVPVVAVIPAAFYTILIVMDQQITAVIINRRDNRLRKGCGYHLDMLVIALLVLVCSLLGLPFYVAATVLSVMHVDALKLLRDATAPGEQPQFLGIKEQRLTSILAHVMIGMSVMLTPLVKLVPLPVLTGVFLYMGVTSLLGQQFMQRVALLFMPVKHMPDYSWLRMVQMRRVHLFTAIQLLSILALFAVKYTSTVSMTFPLMLIVLVLIRMHLISRLFTSKELQALDDLLPKFNDFWRPRHGCVAKRSNARHNSAAVELTKLKSDDGANGH